MEPDLEELTRKYNLACAWAVRHAIDTVTIPWDTKTKNYLREQGYDIWVELLNGDMTVNACICKGDYWSYHRYEDDTLNGEIQEALNNLGAQVVLNAMIYHEIDNVNQVTRWRIK